MKRSYLMYINVRARGSSLARRVHKGYVKMSPGNKLFKKKKQSLRDVMGCNGIRDDKKCQWSLINKLLYLSNLLWYESMKTFQYMLLKENNQWCIGMIKRKYSSLQCWKKNDGGFISFGMSVYQKKCRNFTESVLIYGMLMLEINHPIRIQSSIWKF